MGTHAYYVAYRSEHESLFASRLGMVERAPSDEHAPAGGLFGMRLDTGWTLLFAPRGVHFFDATRVRDLSTGCELIHCIVETTTMFSPQRLGAPTQKTL